MPEAGSVKNLDAMTEKNSGDKPNRAMHVPDAIPMWFVNVFEAANKEEKNLRFNSEMTKRYEREAHPKTVPRPTKKKKKVKR